MGLSQSRDYPQQLNVTQDDYEFTDLTPGTASSMFFVGTDYSPDNFGKRSAQIKKLSCGL